MIGAGTTYTQLLDNVANYYGLGSDQWVEIAKYGITGENAASILRQMPNVSTVVSKNGDILSYSVEKLVDYTAPLPNGTINSNTQLPSTAEQLVANYPAEMAVNSETGLMEATSGMTKIATGAKVATVSAKVATAVGAVMAGCQIGAQVDQFAYDAYPDLWESQGMWAVNPQTWDSICTTDLGKDLFNIVFGIDKESHVLQAYMDSRAVAQVAQYMQSIGALGDGESEEWDGEKPQDFNIQAPIKITNKSFVLPVNQKKYSGTSGVFSNVYNVPVEVYMRPRLSEFPADALGTSYIVSDSIYNIVTTKKEVSGVIDVICVNSDDVVTTTGTATKGSYTYDNKTVFYFIFGASNAISSLGTNPVNNNYIGQLAWIIQYGAFNPTGIEGISKQPDAVYPTGITPDMTTEQIIGALSNQYPDMIQGALSNDVIQPDGSVKTITYWPVGMPDNIPVDQITGALQPIGGVNTLQDDTSLDDTKPDESLDTAIDLIASPNPQNPTDRIEKTYPDTGDGQTPSAVLPTGSAQALYAVYNPSQAEVNDFGAWLWDSNFFEQLKKLFNDPMQSIIGLHKIFATPATSGRGNIYVGYLDSGVASNLVSKQYTEIDCGTVALYEYFGNALDYQATDVYLYLPFVGIVPLNVDDVTRAEINVKYKVDVLTGACLASVYVTRDAAGGQLYTYAGNCGVQYPLSSGSYMGIVASIAGIVGGVVGTIATGGAMLPVALGAGASALGSARTKVEHSGSLSGNAGAMGIKKPYLIIRRPQTAIADDYLTFDGGSENEKVVLGTHNGFTRVKYINLEGVSDATRSEIAEIETLLKDGVII